MIISCPNCNKKFNIEAKLIPEKGRLLQCSNCNHKWHYTIPSNNDEILIKKIYINEIKFKQNQILSKSEEDETKRIFIEAILSLLTTGVISLDNKFNINFVDIYF